MAVDAEDVALAQHTDPGQVSRPAAKRLASSCRGSVAWLYTIASLGNMNSVNSSGKAETRNKPKPLRQATAPAIAIRSATEFAKAPPPTEPAACAQAPNASSAKPHAFGCAGSVVQRTRSLHRIQPNTTGTGSRGPCLRRSATAETCRARWARKQSGSAPP